MKKTKTREVDLYKELSKISKIDMPLSNYSFPFFLFIKKMIDKCCEDEITDVFFLSREGKFLKLLYDKYVSINNISNCPKSHYMFVSRKAVMNATLSAIEEEPFNSLAVYGRLSIRKFLLALDFSKDEIAEVVKNFKSEIDTEYASFFSSVAFDEVKNNHYFQNAYENKRLAAHDNFNKYLKNCGYSDAQRVAIVDVGWHGTIQNHIYKMGVHTKLCGYYLGYRPSQKDEENNKKEGLLFNTKYSMHAFSHNCYNYEYLCVADHGALIRYNSEGNPVFEDDEDVELYNKYFSKVQTDIFDKFSKICEVISTQKYDDERMEKYITFRYICMINHFKKKEKEILFNAKNNHPDNLADIRPNKTMKYYLFLVKQRVYLNCQNFKFWLCK